jgi:hypothetical protein
MMAHGASQKIATKIQEAVARGESPDFHPGWAAFMMMIQERLMTSYEKYADDAEREAFPFFPEEMDPPSD